jgi:uncharacterized membrane protein
VSPLPTRKLKARLEVQRGLRLAIVIGVVAGLRVMLPLAVVSWGVRFGALHLAGTWLSFLGRAPVAWIFTALAINELVLDQLPSIPSRTRPPAFAARLVSGALTGGAIGADRGRWVAGAVAGVVGAVLGTLGGHAARLRAAAAFGRDRPAAFLEDAIALVGALAAAWI